MTDPDRQTWDRMLSHLRAQHPEICRQWFEEIEPLGLVSGSFCLRAHSGVHREYLERHCASAFNDAFQNATGHLLPVRFLGPDEEIASESGGRAVPRSQRAAGFPDTIALNPDYNFATFVVGPANRYAHAAAVAVSERPGQAYNPLFIHGGVGLGKTHLLQAICLSIREHTPDAIIQYFSCESFVTRFTDAIRAGEMTQFRHWFRDVDVLVIDDIHFLAAKERSQEEFFHTFNALFQANKQIVLSSDASPEHIPDLEDRLVSRFKWGLVTELEPPDFETRVAIIKSKARLRGLEFPDDAAHYIATVKDTNIRELEGAITTLQMYSNVERTRIDVDLARRALGQNHAGASAGPSIQIIIDTVTDFYNVRVTDLQSKRRQRSIALPRQVCMYLARKHTRHSLEEIGGYFGGRDHTTVMHAVKTIEGRKGGDPEFHLVVDTLERRLRDRRA
ncbi:MAG: chromosomal replication initiator protein DnaA [Phycisphaeraceae bacterium]|nr:chromosomal replication initiator protein DnaA [Phycisphaeraceae bacterium]